MDDEELSVLVKLFWTISTVVSEKTRWLFLSLTGTPLFEVQPWTVSSSHRWDVEWRTLSTSGRCQNHRSRTRVLRITYDALDIVLKVLLKGASTSWGFHTEKITCETEMCFKQTVFCMLCYEFWIFYHFCSIISLVLIIFHRYDCLMDVLRTRFTFCLSYRQKHAKKSSKWL